MKNLSHFLALFTKNLYSWKRNTISSLLEILIPVTLVAILMLIKATNSPEIQKDYSEEVFTFAPNKYLTELDPSYSLCNFYLSKQSSWGYGLVGTKPLINYLKKQISAHPTVSHLRPVSFSTQQDLEEYIKSKDYEKSIKLCFAIQVEETSNDVIEISFRSNSSYVFSKKSPLLGAYMDVYNFYRAETLTEALQESDPNFLFQYLATGFFQTLNYISSFILEDQGINKDFVIKAKSMDKTKFKRNSVLIVIKSIMPLVIYIGYLIPMCKMISAVLKEREERIKELLIVMGISNNCYWSSWIFYYLCIYSVISALVAFIIGYGMFFKSSILWLFVVLWLFGVFCVFYSQFVSIFFKKAKVAIFMSVIFYLLGYVANYGLETESSIVKTITCFIPIVSFHLALNTISDLEIKHSGFNFDSLNFPVKNFEMKNLLIAYPITIFLIAILAVYFENILPSGYVEKKWNYFLKAEYYIKKRPVKTVVEDFLRVEEFVEDVDSALQIQKQTKQAMTIRGLCKNFGERKILKNINLDIYEGQIFALLGHNSSGKTTTISTLIGSIQASAGEMTIGEYKLSENIEQIRGLIGACLQENILFPILTPFEHIKIFSIFKRVPLKLITNDFIFEKLAEVKLLEAKDTPAEKLSGGQKRKLCLAIALLGNSKIIILDEPTSGMDLNSRRYMWDLLKNNKTERIIILTTHYMEEADILCDRVAMLINGSVKCCGSPLYLKTTFGGGYYLALLKEHNLACKTHTEKIISFIHSSISNYPIVVHDLQSEITFQLTFDFIKDSLGFFKELEKNMESLGLRGYSISVTTLEEVFMKIMQSRVGNKVESTHRQSFDETFLSSELSPLKITERKFSKSNQLFSVIKKRVISTKRDIKNSILEVFCPGLMLLLMFGMINWKFFDSYTEKLKFDNKLYPKGETAYNSFERSDEFMLNYKLQMISIPNNNFESSLDPDINKNLYAGVYFEDLDPNSETVNFTIYPNQQILHASAFYYTQLTQCTLSDLGSKIKLKVNNFPFPITYNQSLVFSLSSSYVLITGLSIAFAFVPSSIIIFLSHERVTGVKHLHRISGLSISLYWIGNFIWDMTKQFMMTGLSVIIIYSLDFTIMKGSSNYQMTYYLIFAYSFNSVLTSYFFSFIFPSPSSANVNILAIHLTTGCLLPILLIIILNYELSRQIMVYFIWVFRLFPNFCLNWGIMKLANSIYISTILSTTDVPDDASWEGCYPELFMLIIEGIFCILGIAIAEIKEQRPYICSRKPKKSSVIPFVGGFDEDVEKEAQVAMQTDPSDVVVNIKSLSKMFTSKKDLKIAVDDISFNVYKGECFSILGVNGAGKTTTFKILTGTIAPTDGEVYVHGYNVKNQINEVRQSLGYCPQNDVLNDTLTARETLEIYSDFRGIPKNSQKSNIEKVLDLVGLTEYSEFICGQFSGGNKRKLCLGIAILGFPELVILDEPTAGMDPESRKKVWKVINELKSNQCSVILTSHSMDEAENVSDRITIMTAGRLRCLGEPTYIKQKFGDDFELQLKLENPSQFEVYDLAMTIESVDKSQSIDKEGVSSVLKELDCVKYYSLINQRRSGSAVYWTLEKNGVIELNDLLTWLMIEKAGDSVVQFLRENYDEIKIEEHYLTYFKIKIINDEDISLGGIFHLIEINKKMLKIAGYSLSQTSLDQIFNRFATVTNASGYMPSSPTFQSKVFNMGNTRLSDKS